MENRLNTALYNLKRSAIREFSKLAKETPGCVALTLGEPDFDTPAEISACLNDAILDGDTHYIDNNGNIDLRREIAKYEKEHNGMDYEADEVIVTIGATEGLFTALFGVINPGDEVIIPTPAFVLYEQIVTMCRGVTVAVDTSDDGFQLSYDKLSAAVTPKTKAIILNSPNNPTGCVYNETSLKAVYDIVKDKGIFVICDDVYRQLIYGCEYHSFAEYRDLRDRIIVIQSFSKPYAMTGWRVGYLLVDRPVKERLELVHQYTVVSSASIVQKACISALNFDPSEFVSTYSHRREYMLKRLRDMGMEAAVPDGAFYVFPSIEKYGLDSQTFCRRMITEAGLAATPGYCFGSDKHIRLTYCYSDKELEDGLDRLEKFIKSLEV